MAKVDFKAAARAARKAQKEVKSVEDQMALWKKTSDKRAVALYGKVLKSVGFSDVKVKNKSSYVIKTLGQFMSIGAACFINIGKLMDNPTSVAFEVVTTPEEREVGLANVMRVLKKELGLKTKDEISDFMFAIDVLKAYAISLPMFQKNQNVIAANEPNPVGYADAIEALEDAINDCADDMFFISNRLDIKVYDKLAKKALKKAQIEKLTYELEGDDAEGMDEDSGEI